MSTWQGPEDKKQQPKTNSPNRLTHRNTDSPNGRAWHPSRRANSTGSHLIDASPFALVDTDLMHPTQELPRIKSLFDLAFAHPFGWFAACRHHLMDNATCI
jgi:hypothetical protein